MTGLPFVPYPSLIVSNAVRRRFNSPLSASAQAGARLQSSYRQSPLLPRNEEKIQIAKPARYPGQMSIATYIAR